MQTNDNHNQSGMVDNGPIAVGRRGMLSRCGMGMGALAAGMMTGPQAWAMASGDRSSKEPLNPLMPGYPQFPSKVKHVIHLFMNGGPSQVDTFDPKPELQRRGGETISSGNL